MAQSLTVTVDGNPFLDGGEPARVILDWVSAGAGTVSLAIASTYATAVAARGGLGGPRPSKIRGKITKIETAPGLNGGLVTALPTDLYDVTILDAYGADVLDGVGANRSGTIAQIVTADFPVPVDSELTLTIANAGDTMKGRIILHLDQA